MINSTRTSVRSSVFDVGLTALLPAGWAEATVLKVSETSVDSSTAERRIGCDRRAWRDGCGVEASAGIMPGA